MDAGEIIRILGMQPHPEGGWYVETWRAGDNAGAGHGAVRAIGAPGEAEGSGEAAGQHGRSSGSAICFLLAADRVSAWHRLDAAEIWHFYAGAPLELRTAATDGRSAPISRTLGVGLAADERPQIVVPAGEWQSARSLGAWTLVGCTVSPAFTFEGFELAPEGWEPGSDAASG